MSRGGGGTAPWKLLVLGGGVAGLLDIVYAIVFYRLRNGVPATRILQSVASGLLGRPAFSGGLAAAALGLFLHFLIAITAAAVYFAASRFLDVLTRKPFLCGPVYGALVYAFMNLVVVPLSHFPQKLSFPPDVFVTGLLAHLFLIGLPIALAARRARYRPPGENGA